jgi:hypothetical protein
VPQAPAHNRTRSQTEDEPDTKGNAEGLEEPVPCTLLLPDAKGDARVVYDVLVKGLRRVRVRRCAVRRFVRRSEGSRVGRRFAALRRVVDDRHCTE